MAMRCHGRSCCPRTPVDWRVQSGLWESSRFRRHFYGSANLTEHLALERRLEEHHGCVNTLTWNAEGTLLVSGSDDRRVVLWEHRTWKMTSAVSTGHTGNIFGASILPGTSDSLLVTGAADGEVRLIDVARNEVLAVYGCHQHRVKRVAVEPGNHNTWVSASEDGTVRQFDRRVADGSTTIVNLVDREAKTVAVHPTEPHYIAVGAGDPYTRVYDRRMLLALDYDTLDTMHCQHYAPADIPKHTSRSFLSLLRRGYVTHVTWDATGSELLANYGGDQLYLFQTRGREVDAAPAHFLTTPSLSWPTAQKDLLSFANRRRHQGNAAFERQLYAGAVMLYSEAMRYAPHMSSLYSNRAAALLHRKWRGDASRALDDASYAICLNDDNMKAYLRKAQALRSLKRLEDMFKVLEVAMNKCA